MTRLAPVTPMILKPYSVVFDDPEWLYEIKHDGFRALAYIEDGTCRLVSRNGNPFQRFHSLADDLARSLSGRTAILDGEVVCLDRTGHAVFADLMKGKNEPYFYAFDLLHLDGEDLRLLPLVERKRWLRSIIPQKRSRLHYVDHIQGKGKALFKLIAQHDLEGIVCKLATSPYDPAIPSWVEIRNPKYTQLGARSELFNENFRGHAAS